jgi:hypothetical protein
MLNDLLLQAILKAPGNGPVLDMGYMSREPSRGPSDDPCDIAGGCPLEWLSMFLTCFGVRSCGTICPWLAAVTSTHMTTLHSHMS